MERTVALMKTTLMENRTINLTGFYLIPFYLETVYFHGRVRVRVRISVWVSVCPLGLWLGSS